MGVAGWRDDLTSPLQQFTRLGSEIGIELFVQRDDLLPFPLAGNKVRKIFAEIQSLETTPQVLITNGAVDSNHCRTTAWVAASLGLRTHVVLHGASDLSERRSPALALLTELGASFEVVAPKEISSRLDSASQRMTAQGLSSHVIAGGCHTPAGARAYREVALRVFDDVKPDFVFVASGTGATQGGMVAASTLGDSKPSVVGVSVARSAAKGQSAVEEAAIWAGSGETPIIFVDDYIAGGYGRKDAATRAAMALGWRYGLPLDGTYTAKAFAALVDYARRGRLESSRVLFWHTGGLWNHMEELRAGD